MYDCVCVRECFDNLQNVATIYKNIIVGKNAILRFQHAMALMSILWEDFVEIFVGILIKLM